MGVKYRTTSDGEIVVPVMDGYKMACCDCGLVHNIDFKIMEEKVLADGSVELRPTKKKGLAVAYRPERNVRSTAQLRRHRHK